MEILTKYPKFENIAIKTLAHKVAEKKDGEKGESCNILERLSRSSPIGRAYFQLSTVVVSLIEFTTYSMHSK